MNIRESEFNSYEQIYSFLNKVNKLFPNPIAGRVDVQTWTDKIINRADIFIADRDDNLIGLIAGYITNAYNELSYITFLAVDNEWQGKGIATSLVHEYLIESRKHFIKGVVVEPYKVNPQAINLYLSIGFVDCTEQQKYKKAGRLYFMYDMQTVG